MVRVTSESFTGISIGSRHWARCTFDSKGTLSCSPESLLSCSSPSVLLPRYAGEPIRFDAWHPTHPRGSGANGPLESIVSKSRGSGRFPLAAVWSGRRLRNASWSWRPVGGEVFSISPVDALATASRNLVARYGKNKTAVIIPNDFHQYEQQRVLDEISVVHPDTQLLWLPIAAALAWLEEINAGEWDLFRGKSLGDLIVVHCDWGHLQCSRLELHVLDRSSAVPIVPARRRPIFSDKAITGFGWALIESDGSLNRKWSNVFASDVSGPIESLVGSDAVDPQIGSMSNWLGQLSNWDLPQQSVSDAVDELAEHLNGTSEDLFGVVVLGDFSRAVATGLNRLRTAGRLEIQRPIGVYSGLQGESLLAKGAAIHLARRASGEISYYDSLPQIELFIDRRGEFDWLDLLEDANHFVPGGIPWERTEPITGFELRRGSSQVKLVLAHEEYEGVREVVSTFDESHEQRTPVSLHVSCTPAQGNAKLRLVTNPTTGHPSREVLANWQRMITKTDAQDRPISKEEYLKSQPRACPELMPRLASEYLWQHAKDDLERLLERVANEPISSVVADRGILEDLKNRLLQKDQTLSPQDATAIGSDFQCPVPSQQAFLERASHVLLALWRAHRDEPHSNVTLVIRALGYLSVDSPEFESWLVKSGQRYIPDTQAVLHTCGLALRNPEHISLFMRQVFDSPTASPGANRLKAVSQILRYRTDATAQIDSVKAAEIIETCLRHFEHGIASRGQSFTFRWSSLIVVYMLRRRMFDPDFLDPSGTLAVRAKALFSEAIDRCKIGLLRPLRGSVNLPAALDQMIAYIDRKGSGDILMAAEE